jgi:hypothetical protein
VGATGSAAPGCAEHSAHYDRRPNHYRRDHYDGPGPGKGGTGVLSVDGRELAKKTVKHTIPMIMALDETFDVGLDTRTGVDNSYELPFKFTGTIDKLTFKLGPSQMSEEETRLLRERWLWLTTRRAS